MDKVLNIDAKRKTVTSADRDPCRRAKEHGIMLQNFDSIQEKQEHVFIHSGLLQTSTVMRPPTVSIADSTVGPDVDNATP
jgi:hypothetical protein